MKIEWTSWPSPLGPLVVVESAGLPLVVEFALQVRGLKWMERLRVRQPDVKLDLSPCPGTTGWLEAYFARRARPFCYPAYLEEFFDLTPQEIAVWKAVCDIPLGQTRSYEDIAQASRLNPRLAGQLVGSNQLAILIPCHRVVGKHGELVGYGGGLPRKRWLLDHELRTAGLVLR
ncbi:MAG TPA: methylated-DNA--[protein]-cysteine S-methyltransferase [Gemmatimonadales bacterium]|jgi:O-6-methylguanine DNA methyltransferase|nr:methylated-DNA--[protein]-cysteine S-methyltransferase [Gemmatimonadales bacterium]